MSTTDPATPPAAARPRGRRASVVPTLSPAERVARGKAARRSVPLASHEWWSAPADRRPPVELLEEQAADRVPELVPIRHGRMLVSPFTYYRGAALPMTADLATTPASGLRVQLCGDAHLSNFGIFGSPERNLFFDVNDFDETATGPWEWDVKRLAASLEVAGRENDFRRKERQRIVSNAAGAYRQAIREFARQPMLEVWYAHLDMDRLHAEFQSALDPKATPSVWHAITNARAHDSHQAVDKLCRLSAEEPRFVSDPPLIVPLEEFLPGVDPEVVAASLEGLLRTYQRTLQPDRRHLLDNYDLVHIARKVVGVGSVGTEAWIVLLLDRGHRSPLVLQVKEAMASVLESYSTKSPTANHGKRVVDGQRLMQAASDIFLGWDRFGGRDFYVRQLRDWKGSADIGGMTPAGMELWGRMCGWTLARAHARSGDRLAIAAYLGKSDAFDQAITRFAATYADQNALDYAELCRAVVDGEVPAVLGI